MQGLVSVSMIFHLNRIREQTVNELKLKNQKLREAVRNFPAERLDDPLVAEPPYTAYTQFIGVTQHNLYHAGQISLLKRALDATVTQR